MQTQLNNVKDYSELAWASYFYFDLEGYILKENDIKITVNEIISSNYNGQNGRRKRKNRRKI